MNLADLKFNKPGAYLAFVLSDESRDKLLKLKRPAFDKVLCHHVTIQFGLTEKKFKEIQGDLKGDLEFLVFGHSAGTHIECFSVKVNDSIKRPDGGFYHVTLSLEPPARPVDSNDLLKRLNGVPQKKLDPIKLTGSFKLL